MLQFSCCGAASYADWPYSRWLTRDDPTSVNKVPDSCCKSPSFACGKSTHPSNIFWKVFFYINVIISISEAIFRKILFLKEHHNTYIQF